MDQIRWKVFALRFIQARDPDWCLRPFLARFAPTATWLYDLQPAESDKGYLFSPDGHAEPAATEFDLAIGGDC